MSGSIRNVTVDCSDAASIARFWSAVTGWPWSRQEMPGNPFWVVGAPGRTGPGLVFVNVPGPGKGRTASIPASCLTVPRPMNWPGSKHSAPVSPVIAVTSHQEAGWCWQT